MRARYEELEIRDCVAPEKAVTGSDIVVAATNSKVPVCKGDWIEKGLHLTGVLPNEFDLDCYKKADSIVIFNRLHGRDYTLRRGPEEEPLDIPLHADLLKDAPEIADLVSKKVPGRRSRDEITIFANGGHGWGHDGGPGIRHSIHCDGQADLRSRQKTRRRTKTALGVVSAEREVINS